MKAKELKERILWIPAWGLSIFAIVFIAFLMMLLSEIDAVYGYVTIGLLTPIACFFICRKDPGSVWYIPILCNLISIPVMFDEGFLTARGWIFLSILWSLSIIAAIIGSFAGRRRVK